MALGFLRGAAAGAAGTTALNAVTYLDMAVRGRGSSSATQDLVEAVADRADVEIPGQGDERDNRLAGLGRCRVPGWASLSGPWPALCSALCANVG